MYGFVLTRTAGQMAVGGKICCLNSPKSHSGLTCEAHLLCNYTQHNDLPNCTTDVYSRVYF